MQEETENFILQETRLKDKIYKGSIYAFESSEEYQIFKTYLPYMRLY